MLVEELRIILLNQHALTTRVNVYHTMDDSSLSSNLLDSFSGVIWGMDKANEAKAVLAGRILDLCCSCLEVFTMRYVEFT